MKKILFFSLILIILAGGIFFWPFFQLESLEIASIPSRVAKLAEKSISTPPPLQITDEKKESEAILNPQKVLEWTNIQRQKYGLLPLEENAKLNAAAQIKIEDMFQNQYFAHYSLLGEGVGDLAGDINYEFLALGENLAMGNFPSEENLVEAWMASPGHRENILNPTYKEIGLAAQKGLFDGKAVWLAVQHFGLPLSTCPQPDETIKLQIEDREEELKELQKLLLENQAELRSIRPKWGSDYQQKLDQYNNLVEIYNNLLMENKTLIERYNGQIQEFNRCLAEIK